MMQDANAMRAPLVKIATGRYRTQDGRYEVERNGSSWEIWQTRPSLGVYEASTLRECAAWLWPYGTASIDGTPHA